MSPTNVPHAELISLSRQLADRDLVALAEGNTSVRDKDSFWVKASGKRMGSAGEDDFVRIDLERALAAIEGIDTDLLFTPNEAGLKPSVEALMHAVCLTEADATWVAHNHSESIVGILASRAGAEAFAQHLYPDAIVVCGRYVASVPYVSPGRDLAIAVRHELRRFAQLHGHLPKTVLLGNHGLVALGTSPTEALNISIMAENGRRYFMLQSVRGAPLLDSGGGNSNRRPTGRTLSTSSIAQSEQ